LQTSTPCIPPPPSILVNLCVYQVFWYCLSFHTTPSLFVSPPHQTPVTIRNLRPGVALSVPAVSSFLVRRLPSVTFFGLAAVFAVSRRTMRLAFPLPLFFSCPPSAYGPISTNEFEMYLVTHLNLRSAHAEQCTSFT